MTKAEQLNSNRLRPKPSQKNKDQKKHGLNNNIGVERIVQHDPNSFDKSLTIRFTETLYRQRQKIIRDIGYCQICDTTNALDAPHHAVSGNGKKDDRTLICICVKCHYTLHHISYDKLPKTRDEVIEIGWKNHEVLVKMNNK